MKYIYLDYQDSGQILQLVMKVQRHPEITFLDHCVDLFNVCPIARIGQDGTIAECTSTPFHTARKTCNDIVGCKKPTYNSIDIIVSTKLTSGPNNTLLNNGLIVVSSNSRLNTNAAKALEISQHYHLPNAHVRTNCTKRQ